MAKKNKSALRQDFDLFDFGINDQGEYHENAKKLVNKFINAYRPLNLVGGCI